MRDPRPQDFDPNPKPAIKPEQVNLSDLSPIKPKPVQPPENQNSSDTERFSERKNERHSVRNNERSEKRSLKFPVKRGTKRYSFEFYLDQIATLKRMRAKAEIAGESINLSEVIRTALDEYLEKIDAVNIDLED
jgi:hypothetical protein